MILPIPAQGLYLPSHPRATGNPKFRNRVYCWIRGHSLTLSHFTLAPGKVTALALCSTCTLYLAIQYPPSPKPIVTLPTEQVEQY